MLETSVGRLRLERPAMLASGILGISMEVFSRLYDSGAGAVVTKSLSTEPWEGYANPTVVPAGTGWVNAVGLSNPGARNFAQMARSNTRVPVIPSLVGSTAEEFSGMMAEFSGCAVAGYEINLSCPHVARVGLDVGDDTDLVFRIISSIRKETDLPILAKVGLGASHYVETARSAMRAGADAITAINTIRAMVINADTRTPVLSNKIGGLSGPPIKPIALRCVYELYGRGIPVVGCGGISCWSDAVEFFLAGASAVQVGSALGDNPGLFADINDGITRYMEQNGYSTVSEMVGAAH